MITIRHSPVRLTRTGASGTAWILSVGPTSSSLDPAQSASLGPGILALPRFYLAGLGPITEATHAFPSRWLRFEWFSVLYLVYEINILFLDISSSVTPLVDHRVHSWEVEQIHNRGDSNIRML
jgi:hypothetical protein